MPTQSESTNSGSADDSLINDPAPIGVTSTELGDRCPRHPSIRMVRYGGKDWCPFCQRNNVRILTTLRRALIYCQWGLVVSFPLLILATCLLAPTERTPTGNLTQGFYTGIFVQTSILAGCLATILGRGFLLMADVSQGGRLRLSPWFHPTHMVRDWIFFGGLFALMYAPFVFFGGNIIPFFGERAANNALWLTHRAPLMLLFGALTLLLLDHFGRITRGALLPPGGQRPLMLVMYAALLVWAWRFVQLNLAGIAINKPSIFWLYVAAGLATFFAIMLAALVWIMHVYAGKLRDRLDPPIQLQMALIGPSNVGKTVFLSRAYGLLERTSLAGTLSLKQDKGSKVELKKTTTILEQDREWPPPTVDGSRIPFTLIDGIDDLVRFTWLDLPGGVFTNPDEYEKERALFDEHLIYSDAAVFMINAVRLKEVNSIDDLSYYSIYKDEARKLYAQLRTVGEGARPVPLAIIITQSCRVTFAEQLKCRRLIKPLAELWIELARLAGLSKPSVRVFISSAVVVPLSEKSNEVPKKPAPLVSEWCVQPVLWLAAQVLRTNIGVVDVASGFAGTSKFQETILRLETAAKQR